MKCEKFVESYTGLDPKISIKKLVADYNRCTEYDRANVEKVVNMISSDKNQCYRNLYFTLVYERLIAYNETGNDEDLSKFILKATSVLKVYMSHFVPCS